MLTSIATVPSVSGEMLSQLFDHVRLKNYIDFNIRSLEFLSDA